MKNIRINVLEAYKLFAETASVVPIQNNHTKGFIILITYPFNKSENGLFFIATGVFIVDKCGLL